MCKALSKDDERRFWSKVAKAGEDECWNWTGAKSKNGYGSFALWSRRYSAHRVSCFIYAGGAIPKTMIVRHKCDNRLCVNHKHLEVGDHADNSWDMVKRGRSRLCASSGYGEANHAAKLTADDVAAIRTMIGKGKTNKEIARLFGVTHQAISCIKLKKSWDF